MGWWSHSREPCFICSWVPWRMLHLHWAWEWVKNSLSRLSGRGEQDSWFLSVLFKPVVLLSNTDKKGKEPSTIGVWFYNLKKIACIKCTGIRQVCLRQSLSCGDFFYLILRRCNSKTTKPSKRGHIIFKNVRIKKELFLAWAAIPGAPQDKTICLSL